jgi:hypothetical protein
MEEYDLQIIKMLEEKKEMIDFIAIYMSLEERNRIGHDIIDIMPSQQI